MKPFIRPFSVFADFLRSRFSRSENNAEEVQRFGAVLREMVRRDGGMKAVRVGS